MKRFFILILLLSVYASMLQAQAPHGINYQAVLRQNNALISNQSVEVIFTLFANGVDVYAETHSTMSNDYGLINLIIGQGIPTPSYPAFEMLDWGQGDFTLQVSVLLDGVVHELGLNELESVPFSFYANRAKRADSMMIQDLVNVNAGAAQSGQVLTWNGSSWEAQDIQSLHAGPGISIQGDSIHNDAPDQTVTPAGSGSVSISGTYPDFIIHALDSNTTYQAGAGLGLQGNTFVNIGDTDPNDDITHATAAGGDLIGTYPAPTISQIQGYPISITNAGPDEVLKWNGSAWEADTDNVNDPDNDPFNEIQQLNLNGINLSLSNGGGTVNLPTYSAGNGLSLQGNTFENTGDIDASDDLTTSSLAGGDISGVFSNLTVNQLQGLPVASTSPDSGHILKWNGIQWAPSGDVNDFSYWNPDTAGLHYHNHIGIGGEADTSFQLALKGNDKALLVQGTGNNGTGGEIAFGAQNSTIREIADNHLQINSSTLSLQTPTINSFGTIYARNSAGDWRSRFGLHANGSGYITVNGSDNSYNVRLKSYDHNSPNHGKVEIIEGGSNAGIKVSAFANPNGIGQVEVFGQNGQPNVQLSSFGSYLNYGMIEVMNDSGKHRGSMYTSDNNLGVVRLDGSNNLPNVVLQSNSPSYPNHGRIDLFDDNGSSRVQAFVNQYDRGEVWVKGNNHLLVGLSSTGSGDFGRIRIAGSGYNKIDGYSTSNGTAYMEFRGSNNSLNARIYALNSGSYSDYGRIEVFGSNSIARAGMFVDQFNQGILFAHIKNFRIPHPTKPEKEIWYASLEGPEAAAYVRGTATLVNGQAQIEFPEHFAVMAIAETMTIILTPRSATSLGLAYVESSEMGFEVRELHNGTGTYSFDWEVKCVRKGYEDFEVVRDAENGPSPITAEEEREFD